MFKCIDCRATGLYGSDNHGREIDRLLAEFKFVTRNPRHIQQIVEKPDHVLQLPLDYTACMV